MSKYYLLDENEYKTIINNLNKKSQKDYHLKTSLEYQYNKLNADNKQYVLAAQNILNKNFSKFYDNEELVIDDDANVSVMEDGAYVQCWIWVENSSKNKKARKQTK